MILSSSDILRILGGDAIIRQEAKLAIVDGKPGIGTEDTVYIYVDKYPTIDEFEATWKIWVQDNSGMGKYILKAMTVLLPSFDFTGSNYITKDFASEHTVVKTEAEKQLERLEVERSEYRKGFEGLSKSVRSRLEGVRDGIDGRDGKDGAQGLPGRDGKDGRDGRDLVATDAKLFDLNDVEQGLQMEPGQVLTWDGSKWTNLFTRQQSSINGGAGASELNDLVDVTIDPDLLEKDFGLVYDGSEWVVASPPVLIEGHNQSGATLSKGTPVYVAGTHSSGKPLLEAADADGAGTYPAIGLLHEDVTDGIDGHVMLSGIIANVDTSSYSAGDALYLSATPGSLTNVRPVAATEEVQKVGVVTRVHATAGSILIIGAGRVNDVPNEITIEGDVEITDSLAGVVLRSPNGTRYRLSVDDSGNLSTSAA